MYRFTGLGRILDPAYATNRAILLLAGLYLVVGAGWAIAAGDGGAAALLRGGETALTGFLAWALARELAPDTEWVAFAAAALALVAVLGLGDPSLSMLFVVLIAVRVVTRSTGRATTRLDTGLLAAGALLTPPPWGWPAGTAVGAALLLDGLLPVPEGQEARRRHLVIGPAVAIGAALLHFEGVALPPGPITATLAAVAAVGVGAAAVRPRGQAVGDVDARPLLPVRVRAGAGLGAVAAALGSVSTGASWTALGPVWGCVAVLALSLLPTGGRSPAS